MKAIPYGRQDVTQADIDAVTEVLRSDWITQGPAIERFEAACAGYCGGRHAVAASSGTAALHLACLALGLGPGELLWTSANTFVASANCARYCGADVDFVDVDPATGNMAVEALAAKLSAARRQGRLPKVVVPVHFAGRPCDMPAMRRLADEYGFDVVEDASHALGARYDRGKVGNGAYSDITVFSFHPVKIVTTGEGGMALSASEEVAARLRLFRSHGITREPARMERSPDGPWYYEMLELGYNYRMTDIQAALGASQLARLDAYVERRRELARRYHRLLRGAPLQLPPQDERSAWHLFVVQVAPEIRRGVLEKLRAAGIQANVHYIPVHLHPYYRARGFREGQFPAAERYYARAISLPLYPALEEPDQERICKVLLQALAGARHE
jgi:UDP-4-amino-4,6-dideoxy-N-acetyl-beta-L-altrosamine transaminase